MKLRIVNKSKDGLTIDFKGEFGLKTFSWEEFKKDFIIQDKVWAIPNENFQKRLNRIEDLIAECIVSVQLQQGNLDAKTKMIGLATLADSMKKLEKELEGTGINAMSLVRNRYQLFIKSLQPKNYHHKKFKKVVEENNKVNPITPTTTFGDLPALQKLKENMDKEGK